ncbi:glutamate-5-semialdehyde dehydrogenase [Haloquadratum walsbyi]|jgi:glutamate-5-semialdehyde dehydrogenase|uniref:Gamma-glutamyl phosphate reductase n=1 Tax=Haloquadratum walsbyi (strain DSM 16790 / HBSQ001) TaxID=362976 RepID=PROA_HALWD|nr:glutamate-5-semialdehyde dehydrogenase [Haloquadratum walsbyi]Q18J39.2 RecName: Full=Gamma-glutamyl phosphate reductase; Short=GPR; AltName: Full=Glutamate-5-semialdehyde dehydrogenase; AltName: Full=Glutamyl-gamma-semialdehyde dehydrogenase; Short=GSA dehydrogenase [Haloquadratum walsbyi DSM 16790]CAJ51972.2 gamma-glutamyl phosphate reductase [Haloquadratum walsbyi DSM 16790]
MTDSGEIDPQTAEEKVTDAQTAALSLSNLSTARRNEALTAIADTIERNVDRILEANAADVADAEKQVDAGEYTQAFVDRLTLSTSKIESIAEMVRSVAEQDDPLGETLTARELDDDLNLYKVTVPIGVIGTVFESRPDALVQISALSLKSGNAVILKGGSEAERSNRVLYNCILEATPEVPSGWAQLIEAREDVQTLLEMDDAVDLIMPRGSSSFVQYVQDNTSIPVLGHTEGVCHVYVDSEADLEMATAVAYDAKVQYPAVCNAVETLLVHESVAPSFLSQMMKQYRDAGVEIRGDERTQSIVDTESNISEEIIAATEADWTTEYGDRIVSIAVVDSLTDAIDHINMYGSKHTESILTQDDNRAEQFMRAVDAASVFHNASTRFADGFRFGLGAEVGISTGKIHARGPVGLDGLTTYKYHLEGDGQQVATYAGSDAKPFDHAEFDETWPVRNDDG